MCHYRTFIFFDDWFLGTKLVEKIIELKKTPEKYLQFVALFFTFKSFGPNTGVSSMNKDVLVFFVLPLGALPSNLKDEPLNAKIHVWCFF